MDPNSIYNTNQAKSVKDKAKLLSLTDVAWFVLYMVWFFNNDYRKQCQERAQAATEQNHQNKNTKYKPKDKKEEIEKDKKQQFADD